MQQARSDRHRPPAGPDLSVFASDEAFWPCNFTQLPSSWYEHVPLAYWVTKALNPACFVELGTHYGLSYLSFCEAIDRLGLATSAYAVDTWQGDEHAGFYGDDVYNKLIELHDPRFNRFSRLVRATFDEACGQFADGSIDLLHIDGLHTYDAVKHDFETWSPKLAPSAVVLFHDTNVRERGFGVWKLWQELAERYPHFEFLHGHGLGILGIGGGFSERINALFAAAEEPRSAQLVRNLFARLGMLVSRQAGVTHTVNHLMAEIGSRDARITELANEIGDRDARVRALEAQVTSRDAGIATRDEGMASWGARIDQLSQEIGNRDQLIQELHSQTQTLNGKIHSLNGEIGAVRSQAAAHLAHIEAIKRTVSWRITRPLRGHFPRKPRKKLKRAYRFFKKRYRKLLGIKRPDKPSPIDTAPPVDGLPPPLPPDPAPGAALPIATHGLIRRPCVIFISGEPRTPGHYYRVENIRSGLATKYYDTVVIGFDRLAEQVDQCAHADLLWIWRTSWTEPVARAVELARNNHARIIFDVDDLMFRPDIAKVDVIDGIRSQDLSEDAVAQGYALVRLTLDHADHATAPTETLAQEFRRTGTPASVIPNGFDGQALALARHLRTARRAVEPDGFVRIGYASGSTTHQRDLAVASEALADILAAHPSVRLVFFDHTINISEFPEFAPFADRIEWRPLVPVQDLPKEYARFDINIAPLEVGNVFCEAKSELKFFEPALCGVVTVASPTRPFRDAIRHGETGFLATTRDQWRQCLDTLIKDPDLRRRTADAALADVLWWYGPERRSVLVNRLVTALLAPPPVAMEMARSSLAEMRPPKQEIDVPPFDVIYASPHRDVSRIAIVIPLFNYAQYVCEALDSVSQQTVLNFELIVVDDRSTDESLEVAKTWLITNQDKFSHVALLQNRQNSKLSRTRNTGISYAGTELVLPLDADNLLMPACVERCMALLDETNAAMVYPTIELFGDRGGVITDLEWNVSRLQFGNYIDAMAMFRTACWLAVGGYTPIDYGWEDYDLWCKFAELGFWGVRVPEVTARYRVHGESMLQTITEVPKNRKQVTEVLASRHPWLDLPAHDEGMPADTSLAVVARQKRWIGIDREEGEYLLSIMQCPETGEAFVRDGEELRGIQSGRGWPIVDGRPVFTAEGRDILRQPLGHVSNPLPKAALDLIEDTQGLVLNLSGGAASCSFDHVIEVEYSLFRTTDVAADAHRLPFRDAAFDSVVCLNAFEHYREPTIVASEIRRVLRPGGRLFIHTAFMQPLHEAPYHFFNCTRYGLEEWLRRFAIERIHVSNNLNPVHAFSWLASDLEAAFASSVSEKAAADFHSATVGSFVNLWRDEATRNAPLWQAFYRLPQEVQERFAAGWEVLAYRPSEEAATPPN